MKKKLTRLSLLIVLFHFISPLQLIAQTAGFTASPLSGCAPLNVTFTNTSSGATSYSWNFGNGNTSTQTNPSAIYSLAGTYTVTLVASNGSNTNTHTATITVYANPIASFTTSSMPACAGTLVTFTSTSTIGSGPINSFAWDFGDGNGITTITGTTTHSYANGGTFPVNLIVTDIHGCTSSVIIQVSVLSAPVASFTASPLSSCTPPLTVNFTNTSTSTGTTTYSWNFGDGGSATTQSPSHTYTANGNYTITLVVTQGGCSDTITMNNYIHIHPMVANFTSNVITACVGAYINFTDLSSPLSVSRTWDFGDGNTSTAANPSHAYFNPGTYTVSLLNATDPIGCTDSKVVNNYITINPLPNVNFTATPTTGCSAPMVVTFNNTSGAGNYSWSFGDGGSSLLQNPVYTYNYYGTYYVTLWMMDANGCMNSFTRPNYIRVLHPETNYSAQPLGGCIPLQVTFTDTTHSPGDPVVSFQWNFGDGSPLLTTSTSVTSHTYTTYGNFTTTLIVTTAAGCRDTVTFVNYIHTGPHPTAGFTISDSVICYGTSTIFNDLSTNSDSVLFLFNDGGVFFHSLPYSPISHTFTDTGYFNVTQIVYNNGCSDTLTHNNIVQVLPPLPLFLAHGNCITPYNFMFTNASGGADSVYIDFGDGTPLVSNFDSILHVFTTPGSHLVTITAFNFTTGCSDSYSSGVNVVIPVASFTVTPPSGCSALHVFLQNTSPNASSFVWDFGDGTVIGWTDTISHTYALPGIYNAQLTITNFQGCSGTVTIPIHVEGPTANFTANATAACTPSTITFSDFTTDDTTLVSWHWIFGDGNQTTVSTPTVSHTYMNSGNYSVTMIVTDIHGCKDTLYKPNYIQSTFPLPVMVADSFACRGDTIIFNASGTSVAGPATYYWNYGDLSPTDTTTSNIMNHIYPNDGIYTVSFTVVDVNGCSQTITHLLYVQTPVAMYTDSVIAEGCGFTTVQFINHSTGLGITQWHWLFGDGASSTQPNPTHTYSVPGYYTVSLTVTNAGMCSTTAISDSLVLVQGPLGTFTFSPATGCNPLTVYFTASSNNTSTYTWDFGDGTVITTTSPTIQHTYTQDIVATPILLLTDTLANGTICQLPAPTAGQVTVITTVHVDIDSTVIVLEEGETEPLNATVTGVSGDPVFMWSPAAQLGCSNCQNTTVTGDDSGQTIVYVLTVTDSSGCIGRDTVRIVYLKCDDSRLLIPNVFSPNNDRTNDFFEIKGLCLKSTFLIQIFNRWGIKVFETTDRNNSWDGKENGGPDAAEGVYYYIITLDKATYTGFVQVLR